MGTSTTKKACTRPPSLPEARGFMVPLPSFEMPPHKKAHFIVHARIAFQCERIVVPDAVAPSFAIHNIVIGETPALGDMDPIPATVFGTTSLGVNLALPTLQESVPTIDVVVENITDAPTTFTMVLMGSTFGDPFSLDDGDVPSERYHAWAETRQRVFESIYRGDDEMTVFNGYEVTADMFMPKRNIWWVNDDGYKVRPLYDFEDIAMGEKRGGLQAVDVTTYEGFE